MHEKLNLKEIKEQYKDEWILLLNPETSTKGAKIEGGEVVFHSKDRGQIHRILSDFKGNKALVYTGEIPEDVEVLL